MTEPLRQIEGFDLDDALQRVESTELLAELLLEFVARWSSGAERIQAALGAGDRQRAENVAHALTGVAATLALVDVRGAAGRIERLLAAGAGGDLGGDVAALATALERVRVAIERELGSSAGPRRDP